MTVLTMMGFRKQTEDGEDFFVVDKLMPSCVSAVAAALAPAAPAAPRPAPAALNADGTPKSSCCAPQTEKLSTKQQARRLVEEQEAKQRQAVSDPVPAGPARPRHPLNARRPNATAKRL